MSATERYYALLSRQENKVSYAPSVARAFQLAADKVGPNPSFSSLAAAVDGKLKPSASSKSKKGWTAQTVADWLSFDGIEPTEANIAAMREDRAANPEDSAQRMRKYGARAAAVLMWLDVRDDILRERGAERFHWEQQRLADHLMKISIEARSLRAAIGMREHAP